jgi:hypothetical protein
LATIKFSGAERYWACILNPKIERHDEVASLVHTGFVCTNVRSFKLGTWNSKFAIIQA